MLDSHPTIAALREQLDRGAAGGHLALIEDALAVQAALT